MNKKLAVWTTVILAGALILGYHYIQKLSQDQRAAIDSLGAARAQAADPQTSPTTAPAAAPATTPAPATTTTQPATASAPAAAPTPAPAPRAAAPTLAWYQLPSDSAGEQKIIPAGNLDPGTGYLFQANLDRTGASVQTLKLSDIFVTVADKQAWEDCNGDHAKYMAEVAKSKASGGPLKGHYNLLKPVGNYRPYATQRITLRFKGSDAELPAILLGQMTWKYEGLQPTSKPAEGMEVAFSATLSTDQYFNNPAKRNLNLPAVKITKTYTVSKNDYSLKMRLKVENLSNVPLEAYVDQLGPAGVPREEHYRGGDDRFMLYGKEKDNSGDIETVFKPHAEIQDGKVPLERAHADRPIRRRQSRPVGGRLQQVLRVDGVSPAGHAPTSSRPRRGRRTSIISPYRKRPRPTRRRRATCTSRPCESAADGAKAKPSPTCRTCSCRSASLARRSRLTSSPAPRTGRC